VHDEGEVGLVETHAERRRGHHDLQLVGQQSPLDLDPVGVLTLPGVGDGVYVLALQPLGEPVGIVHGEAVDDPAPG